jgi:predicted TIM-barrel fold metal-dependent hydrolase
VRQDDLKIIDFDVHELPVSPKVLKPYIAPEWAVYVDDPNVIPNTGFTVPIGGTRKDALRADGTLGSMDVEQIIWQHVDAHNITYAILTGILAYKLPAMPQRLAAAGIAAAYNDWLIDNHLARDPRFKGSITVAPQIPSEAAREIDRVGSHPNMVQVALPVASPDLPWGSEFFHPIWEAAIRNDLRVAFHIMQPGHRTGTPSSVGWPSTYMENRSGYPTMFQLQLISLVCNGVFAKYPELKVVFLEGGFAWVPSVMWRLDQSWKSLRLEVPWLTRRPSEYIREHVRFSTQPFEEPDEPRQLVNLIDMMGSDRMLVFASDYPHWDFDDPRTALPAVLGEDLIRKILWENGREFYGFPEEAPIKLETAPAR